MTQEQLAYIVDRAPRTIMYHENDGQHPSFNTFYQLVTMFDISVDQYFYPSKNKGSECRKRIDAMLNALDEKELKIVEATIQAMKAAKETVTFVFFTPCNGSARNGKQFGCGHTPKFLLAAGPQKCLLGSSPNPLNFGTNCPKVPALCACCLRPVAIAPGPYFPARPSSQADDQCSP